MALEGHSSLFMSWFESYLLPVQAYINVHLSALMCLLFLWTEEILEPCMISSHKQMVAALEFAVY